AILLLDAHSLWNVGLELALGTLHFDDVAADVNLHTRRDRNWFFTDSRHLSLLSLKWLEGFWLPALSFQLSLWSRRRCPLSTVHSPLLYQTSQRISPPTPFLRASRPVITPLGVVRMLMS